MNNKTIKVSYQGIPGAYSHLAAQKYFKKNIIFCPKQNFKNLFASVLEKKCLYAVIPMENSIIGKIKPTQILFNKYKNKLFVVAKISLKISHCLLAIKKVKIKKITKAYSHPQALLQCQNFFNNYPWIKAVKHQDTAASAQLIAKLKKENIAAIASRQAGKIYKLKILKENIQNNKKNYTYFYIMSLNK